MSRNAIHLAIKSLDRKEALEFRKEQNALIENESGGMSSKVKLKPGDRISPDY